MLLLLLGKKAHRKMAPVPAQLQHLLESLLRKRRSGVKCRLQPRLLLAAAFSRACHSYSCWIVTGFNLAKEGS